MKIPQYESTAGINPTPLNPELDSTQGREVRDLAKGLESLSDYFAAMRNKTQSLKAETSLADTTKKNWMMATTDPDIDNLQKKVDDNYDQGIQNAANLIQDPNTRDNFIEKARADADRKSIGIYNRIYQRQNKDYKDQITKANDADISDYQMSADPRERGIIKQQSFDRVDDGIKNGYLHGDATKHLQKLWEQADKDQIQKDGAIDPENTYKQLQKGNEGIYKDVPEGSRQFFMKKLQTQMEKDGMENKHAFAIAQNHTDNLLIDKMAQNKLTVQDVIDARTKGINGIPASMEFSNAALKTLQDPFPTDSTIPGGGEKYIKLTEMATDPSNDPIDVKTDIMLAQGITPQQKGHLLNSLLRQDPQEGKKSIDDLIQSGIKKNKQDVLEAGNKYKQEIKDRQNWFYSMKEKLTGQAGGDNDRLAKLQQDYFEKEQNAKDMNDRIQIMNGILKQDTLLRNPQVSQTDAKGTLVVNKLDGRRRMQYPDGHWEPVK
jgi:hypothetical protein